MSDDEFARVMVLHIDGSSAVAVENVPGPADLVFADSGRALVFNRTTVESDIWLLELADGIDD